MTNAPSRRPLSRRDFLKMSGISALSVGSLTILTACGPSTATTGDDSAEETNSSEASSFGSDGKLRVGMEVAYPPYNWQVSEPTDDTMPVDGLDGAYADGIDVYVSKHVAEAMGLEAVAVKLAWSGLIEALNSGQIDCIIAGMTPTPDREESIDFTDPYFVGYYGLLTRKDSPYANANCKEDLDGAAILGQKDTLLDTAIDEYDNVEHLTPVDSVPAQLSHLNEGACDCITYNIENREGLLEANPDLVAIDFDGDYRLFDIEASCNIGLKKGQEDIVDQMNGILDDMFADDEERDQIYQTIIARQPA